MTRITSYNSIFETIVFFLLLGQQLFVSYYSLSKQLAIINFQVHMPGI